MDYKYRIIGAVLGLLAGLLEIFTAIAERPAGAPVAMSKIALGVFWIAFGVAIYIGAGKKTS